MRNRSSTSSPRRAIDASKAASVRSRPWSSFQTLVVTKTSSRGTSLAARARPTRPRCRRAGRCRRGGTRPSRAADTAASTSSSGTCQTPKPMVGIAHGAGGRGEVGRRHVGHGPRIPGDPVRTPGVPGATGCRTCDGHRRPRARTLPRRRRTGAWADAATLPRVTDDRAEVHRAEGLREQQHPEGRADDGVDQARRRRRHRHPCGSARGTTARSRGPTRRARGRAGRHDARTRRGPAARPRPRAATGSSSRPPATSCHEVVTSTSSGGDQRLTRVKPRADDDDRADGGGHARRVHGPGPVVLPDQGDDTGDPDDGGDEGDRGAGARRGRGRPSP